MYTYTFIIIVVSAKGFEYDDLYVTLHLELPDCKYINFQYCIVYFEEPVIGILLEGDSCPIAVIIELKLPNMIGCNSALYLPSWPL